MNQQAQAPEPPRNKPGCIWPILWVLASAIGTVILAAVVILFAADSESQGVTATQIAALPAGFLWAGSLAAIITYFIKTDSKGVRYGMPFGCGCLGGITLLLSILFFFLAVWPSL